MNSVPSAGTTGNWRVFVEAARPRTLPAGAAPVVVGIALAYAQGALRILPAALALFGALAIQVGTNYANDYYDAKNGADTDARIGPRRATQAGLVAPQTMRLAFIIAFALACAAGAWLMALSSVKLLWVGLASVLFGVLYTGGPRPLGYLGLGDVLVFVFFGPVAVAGTVYVQAVDFGTTELVAGACMGALSTAILVVNNLRDRHTDIHANKRTLAVRFGATFVRIEYALCLVVAVISVVWVGYALHNAYVALVLLAAPRAVTLLRRLWRTDGPALNPMLGQTAQLLLLVALLFAVALSLPRALGG